MILWCVLSLISMIDYIPMAQQLKGWKIIAFFIVFAIGGPIFAINQLLTTILDCILPEGWNGDDDFMQGY